LRRYTATTTPSYSDFFWFSVLTDNKSSEERNIFLKYRNFSTLSEWKDDHTIVIDGIRLYVRFDTYDWRKDIEAEIGGIDEAIKFWSDAAKAFLN